MSIEIKIHTILYFPINDLNALNRMLTVKFELKIYFCILIRVEQTYYCGILICSPAGQF